MRVAVIYDFFPHYRVGVMRELLRITEHRYTLVADEKFIDSSLETWQIEGRNRFIHAPYRKPVTRRAWLRFRKLQRHPSIIHPA